MCVFRVCGVYQPAVFLSTMVGWVLFLCLYQPLVSSAELYLATSTVDPPKRQDYQALKLNALGYLPIDDSTNTLFAVVGSSGCAEQLKFGPELESYPDAYLSTSSSEETQYWTQYVTKDGTEVLYTIYWTFEDSKTIADRILNAVTNGEHVTYRVVEASTSVEHELEGIWRFSTGAVINATALATASNATCCLSADDGVWGAGNGVIDGYSSAFGFRTTQFWGQGNWDKVDSEDCYKIYADGRAFNYGRQTRSYLYFSNVTAPTAGPTQAPSGPSAQPTRPTVRPTPRPSTPMPSAAAQISVVPGYELFAVVGGDACGENLFYGPQGISVSGSEDGLHRYYLSTNTAHKHMPHWRWVQILRDDATNQQWRIDWQFYSAKTLAQRFVDAVRQGEPVLINAGVQTAERTNWWFASQSGLRMKSFATENRTCCFSETYGAWGTIRGSAADADISPEGASVAGMGMHSRVGFECAGYFPSAIPAATSFLYYETTETPVLETVSPVAFSLTINATSRDLFTFLASQGDANHILSLTVGRCLVGLNVQVSVPKYIFSLSDGVALLDVTMDTVDATYESVVAQYVQSNFRAEVLKVLRAQPGYASSGSTFDDFEVIASVQDYRVVTPDTGGGEEGGGNEEEDEGGGGDGGSFTMKRLTSTTVDVLIAMAAFYLLLAACVCCFRLSNTSSAANDNKNLSDSKKSDNGEQDPLMNTGATGGGGEAAANQTAGPENQL